MIFVCVGSRGYQFNRLLKQMDKLVADRTITEDVFAQTGLSDYTPIHYSYKNYMDVDQFKEMQKKAEALESQGYLFVVRKMEELGSVILQAKKHPISKKYQIPSNVIKIIDGYIQGEFR